MVARLLDRLPPQVAARVRQRVRRLARPARLGSFRQLVPLSQDFGYDRGTPVDRYYIERFLDANRARIRGSVLEVKDSAYTNRFGSGVRQTHVLDIDPGNPLATMVADLTAADSIPNSSFDCFILTQTLHLIYDVRSAVEHAHRILKPDGTLLVTVPVVSPIANSQQADYWRFTPASCAALFGGVFGGKSIRVRAYGNVLTSIAFLAGMAYEELTPEELATHDPRFATIVSVNAVKT